jgi:hypothetical protein
MEGQAGERRSRVAPAGVKEKDAKNDNAGSRKGLALSFGGGLQNPGGACVTRISMPAQ